MKKIRKNQHQKNTAIAHKDIKPKKYDQINADHDFIGYNKGNGKCRLPDGSFNHYDSYFPTGPNDMRPKSI